jgi:uncharacterized membrane protein
VAHNKPRRKQTKPQTEVSARPIDEDLEIDSNVAKVIQDLPPDKKEVILHALAVRQSYSGPLPDGETIRVYGEVIPDGGNRLMNNVETQLAHRIRLEDKGLNRSFNQSSTGQWMAFGIAVLFGLIAWDLARNGSEMAAIILGSVDLVALVAVFITGKVTK